LPNQGLWLLLGRFAGKFGGEGLRRAYAHPKMRDSNHFEEERFCIYNNKMKICQVIL
jgi:hypothetical protein